MEGFGHLIPRFPDLLQRLQERMEKDGGLKLVAIMEVAGPAIGPIIAAGFGLPGNEQAEHKAAQLSASQQMDALEKIVDKTMPDGLAPFVGQWATLMQKFAPQQRKPRFKVLPRESNSSAVNADTPLRQSGG
jgi:hypothetical protein